MTLTEALKMGEAELAKNGVPEAKLTAWYLFSYAFGCDRTRFFMDASSEAQTDKVDQYKSFLKRRASREPLEHIIGETEFMGLPFWVNEDVLIPRQDTETLVELVLNEHKEKNISLLDVCTGSGCILISILKNVKDTSGCGYDISKQAINVAKENAKLNDVSALFERSDLFEDVMESDMDVIVSNPPYIPSEVVTTLMPEVVDFEPHEALDGKEDGLYFYRKIIDRCKEFLKPQGYLLFEIGYDQGEAVSSMLRCAGFEEVRVIKDLARNDRVVMGHL